MKTAREYAEQLREVVAHPDKLPTIIQKFLDDYWIVQDHEVADLDEWEILGELASDLEYYEADPDRRTEPCLLSDEQAIQKIVDTLQIFDTFQTTKGRTSSSSQPR